jgi:predicted heme/steroid binding protein
MDEFEMKRRIYGYIKEICHYSQMQVFATSYYQKNYFQMQIDDSTTALISLYTDLWKAPEHHRRSNRYHYQENSIESYEQILQPGERIQQPEGQIYQPEEQVPEQEQQLPGQDQQLPELPSPETQPEPSNSGLEPLPEQEEQETRSFTVEELSYYDGTVGRPAYVAVNGIVYDVSSLVRWSGGQHFGMHAGRDLTGPFMGCHQGILDRLNKVPMVGVLVKGGE